MGRSLSVLPAVILCALSAALATAASSASPITFVPTPPPGSETAFTVTAAANSYPISGGDFTDEVYDAVRNRIYITDSAHSEVQVFDLTTRTYLTPVPVGAAPSSLDITSDSQRLLVTNAGGLTLSSINLQTNVVTPLNDPTAHPPFSIAVGNEFALYGSETEFNLRQVNLATNNISLGHDLGSPALLASSFDRNFAAFGTTATQDRLGVLDFATRDVASSRTIAGGVGSVAANYNATVNAATQDAAVIAFDRNAAQLASLPITGPSGFTWSGKYLLTGTGNSGAHVFNTQTWSAVSSIADTTTTVKLLMDPLGNRIYLLNPTSLQVVDIADLPPTAAAPQNSYDAPFGIQLRIPVTVTDSDGETTDITAFDLPPGATIEKNATGADIVFTPTQPQVGQTFKFTVFGAETNGIANSAPLFLSIHVIARTDLDLTIVKTASTNSTFVGQPFTYVLNVTNHGPAAATNVVVRDNVPSGVVPQSASATQGSVNAASNPVTWTVGSLTSGANASATINVKANSAGSFDNGASISSDQVDSNLADNSSTATVSVADAVDLHVTTQVTPDPAQVGTTVTATITVTNGGPSTATNVSATVALPTDASNIEIVSGNGAVLVGTGINWTIGTLAPSGSAQLQVTYTHTAPGNYVVTATATADQHELNAADNTSTAQSRAFVPTNVQLTVQAFPNPIFTDRFLSLTYRVTNPGSSTLNNVQFRLNVPASMKFVRASAWPGTWTFSNGQFHATEARLFAHRTWTIHVTLQPKVVGTFNLDGAASSDGVNFAPASNAKPISVVSSNVDFTVNWVGFGQSTQTFRGREQQVITGSVTVHNVGTSDSHSTFIDVFISSDGLLNDHDIRIAHVFVTPIVAGGSQTLSFTGFVPRGATTAGKSLIAGVDPFHSTSEISELNNTAATGPLQ